VSRLVAGSVGTSYATSILSARRDAFYDTLAGNLTWGSSGAADLLARISELGGQAAQVFDSAAWTKATAMVQELLLLRAWSYAFEASYPSPRRSLPCRDHLRAAHPLFTEAEQGHRRPLISAAGGMSSGRPPHSSDRHHSLTFLRTMRIFFRL
jgi:hypothetical protein